MSGTKQLCTHPLDQAEKEMLLVRVDDLLRTLGSPGDWGYGTKLGDLTLHLLALRAEISAAKIGGAT